MLVWLQPVELALYNASSGFSSNFQNYYQEFRTAIEQLLRARVGCT